MANTRLEKITVFDSLNIDFFRGINVFIDESGYLEQSLKLFYDDLVRKKGLVM